MRRFLLVSYYFPPRFSVGGKRAFRFAKGLREHGWEATVLTAKPPATERLDPTFGPDSLAALDVRSDYLTDAEHAKLTQRAYGSDGTIEAPTTPWTAMRDRKGFARLRAELRVPTLVGPDKGGIPSLARRIARLAKEVRAELVFATGAPWEAPIAGIAGARLAGLPVVVDFRDPWSFGPVIATRPAWARAAEALIEKTVISAADALTVTSSSTLDGYARIAPAAHIEAIPTGFDEDVPYVAARHDAVTLIHFGNVYGTRSLAPLLRALAVVVKDRGLGPDALRVLNLGRVSEPDLSLAKQLAVSAHFQYRAVVPYAEGLGLVAGADLAVLFGFGEDPWFLPAKLFDYLRVKVPTLAIGTSPEAARIIADTQLGFAHEAVDVRGIAARIAAAVDARRSGAALVTPNDDEVARFASRNTSRVLARLFDGL